VVGVATALHRRGQAVMVTCSTGGALSARLLSEGIEVRELGGLLVKRRVSLLFAWRLRRLVREKRPQVVHTHMYASGVAGMLATWGTGVPLVHTEHSEALWRGVRARWISRCMYRRSWRVIAVSVPIQQRLVEQDKVPPDRISVIPCCVTPAPVEDTDSLSPPPRPPIVGVVARLQPEKGVGDFLDASVQVAREMPTCSFVVIGDGPLRGRLTVQAQRLGLATRVWFLGFRSDARALIAKMDLLVVPSWSEGMPLVILEAMTAGVPVVATSVGGIPDQVRHGVEGLLVPASNPLALSRGILTLLRDPVMARRYGEAGRQRAAQQFNYEKMIHGIEHTYHAAVSRSVFKPPVTMRPGERP
jgi:glycosyltransferase involved in cell wall biosynthesis